MAVKVRAKIACDCCHQRKVKCIVEGTAPCKRCISDDLACTYNNIPQKKGPKGSRAKILSELRETQRNAQLAAGFPTDLGFDGRTLSSTFARTPGLMPPALVESCIEYFFAHVYPSEPVLHRQRAQEAAVGMDRSTEAYCMVVALCAYVMIQANHKPPVSVLPRPEMAHVSNVGIGHVLLEESVRVRQGYDHRENPTHYSVLTSWFYSGCYFGLARENTAWTYLRDATTQAQLLGMHDEETYKHDPLDISRKRVLYWLLFIAERTYALHKHRPITLHPTIHPPSLDEVPSDRPIAVGLELMINMFKVIDDTFINLWNRVHNTHASAAWITQVHTQLSEAVPTYFECTEVQEVQIRITQQWLRSQAWQLSVCQGLVSSVSNDIPLTFKYPIEIARDLLTISHQFSQQAMEMHGVGLIEKLFDVARCLTDVVACTSFSPNAFALGPRDYVSRFLTLISALRGGQTRYLPLLLAKLSEVLPNLPLPQSLNLPQTVPTGTLGLDAQPPYNIIQYPMVNVSTTHVGDMSLYDS
ncbi:transcription factor Pf2 [Alternaria alternata]|nr:transcription factor Pf2 [Alternaria alternata]